MARNETTSKIIDEIIRYGSLGGAVVMVITLPGMAIALEKPLGKLLKHLDKRERVRELRRIVNTMKSHGYLAGDYENGLRITKKASQRLAKMDEDNLCIAAPRIWDKHWRIIIYDIPETHKNSRDALARKLRHIGCFQLQKSTWITPFPCKDEVMKLAETYNIASYITLFVAMELENSKPLITRFCKKYPQTKF